MSYHLKISQKNGWSYFKGIDFMKKVLFVANHLTVGGIQKSLISALNSIDYSANEVTLYIRKNRLDLLPYVNKNVKILINEDDAH